MGQQSSHPSDENRSRDASFSQPPIPPPAKFKDGPLKGRFTRKKKKNKYRSTGETEDETDIEVLAAGRQKSNVNGWFQAGMETQFAVRPFTSHITMTS